MQVLPAKGLVFDSKIQVVIVGGGACGMAAALAASDAGAEVLVLERDAVPTGSTALSSGMIPACNTRIQREKGIEDTVEIMVDDIQSKAGGFAEPTILDTVCRTSGPMIDWLTETHGVELTLVEGFLFSKHSLLRMHAPPSRTGEDLIRDLARAADEAGIMVMSNARAVDLYADENQCIHGIAIERPDGSREVIGCGALILACNGFAGNPELVAQYLPEIAGADFIGHPGNQGEAIMWGKELGAEMRDLSGYQGHGSIAHPQAILITWSLQMNGGFQVNTEGRRFSAETDGYSEATVRVLSQPGKVAWNIYDENLHKAALDLHDYRVANETGALLQANSIEELAELTKLPLGPLRETIEDTNRMKDEGATDEFGRDFTGQAKLEAPFRAVKVSGYLSMTQGGLVVDENAQVRRENGGLLPNLFAGGGSACGVSGPNVWGYFSGAGLLCALTLGRLAGTAAGDIGLRSVGSSQTF
jgi:fumarate reductase flavoprotein subunit